jgi:hypothetical protein
MGLSLTALLSDRPSVRCAALAEAPQPMSHDRLTNMWQADWSGHTCLESIVRTLFAGKQGSLILEETVVPNPYATVMDGLVWVFSSRERKPLYSFSLVRLIWTDGTRRIPLGVRLW